jgi:hypothetical protein
MQSVQLNNYTNTIKRLFQFNKKLFLNLFVINVFMLNFKKALLNYYRTFYIVTLIFLNNCNIYVLNTFNIMKSFKKISYNSTLKYTNLANLAIINYKRNLYINPLLYVNTNNINKSNYKPKSLPFVYSNNFIIYNSNVLLLRNPTYIYQILYMFIKVSNKTNSLLALNTVVKLPCSYDQKDI